MRWRYLSVATFAAYSRIEDSQAKLLDLPTINGDYRPSMYDLGLRTHLHATWALVGAGVFIDTHEHGTVTRHDLMPSTYELHDKYLTTMLELHAGITFQSIRRVAAPQLMAAMADDVYRTVSLRLGLARVSNRNQQLSWGRTLAAGDVTNSPSIRERFASLLHARPRQATYDRRMRSVLVWSLLCTACGETPHSAGCSDLVAVGLTGPELRGYNTPPNTLRESAFVYAQDYLGETCSMTELSSMASVSVNVPPGGRVSVNKDSYACGMDSCQETMSVWTWTELTGAEHLVAPPPVFVAPACDGMATLSGPPTNLIVTWNANVPAANTVASTLKWSFAGLGSSSGTTSWTLIAPATKRTLEYGDPSAIGVQVSGVAQLVGVYTYSPDGLTVDSVLCVSP